MLKDNRSDRTGGGNGNDSHRNNAGLRFNSQNPHEAMLGSRRRVEYSVESGSVMNNRNLRDSTSHMRGSAKNLKELGSLRDSGSME